MFKKSLWQGLTYLFALLLVVSITVANLLEAYRGAVDTALGTTSSAIVTDEDDDTVYKRFTPMSDVLNADGTGNSKALIAKAIDLGRRESQEGSVLLKNRNHILPLASGSKVTLLGIRSHIPLLNSGMGNKSQGPVITLEDALGKSNRTDFANHYATNGDYSRMDNYDIQCAGYELNPTTIAAYEQANATAKLTYNDRASNTFDAKEPSLDSLKGYEGFETSLTQYNDAAIVVVGRPAGESTDYIPHGVVEGFGAEEPLQLSANERAIIEYATQKFNKVIVLVNTNSAMEIGDLQNNDKISAILWIGHPGNYGTLGIADILTGKVSPSGGLYDIYATNNLSAPAMVNMGRYSFSNASELTRTKSANYVVESESIYVGYRYYETRYYDGVYKRGNADSEAGVYASSNQSWNYSQEVTYGFGYGLSYATFEQKITAIDTSISGHDITTTVEVTVKNTHSSVSGKSIVQVYAQAPYVVGGVEKSAIQLVAFDKTETLAPGAEEKITLTVDWQYLASWDSTVNNGDGTKGSYILDPGNYYFAIGNGAHDALNNVLALQNKTTSDGMDYNGNANLARSYQYRYSGTDKTTYHITKNNTAVSNAIEYADWNYYEAGKVTHLSRADWKATYPKEYSNMAIPASMFDHLNGKYYEVQTGDDTSSVIWGSKDTEVKFYQMAGADWDDPRWESLLNQMTMEEGMRLVGFGGPTLPDLPSIDFAGGYMTENAGNGIVVALSATKDPNAPWAIGADDNNASWNPQVFPSGPVVASSFNPELFYELGAFVGVEALFTGIPILWGPGLNTHRHAYNGRNGEYYSEDPILCGNIAMEFAMGAAEYGLIAAPKHFAFNDQETNRNGVAPFMTEQRAREVELRAFQIAIEATKYDEILGKNVGMMGLMTSFSKIGGVECTSSYGLMTSILQNEWGFHGYAVTDINDDTDLYTQVAASGTTCYDMRMARDFTYEGLQKSFKVTTETIQGDLVLQQRIKLANKNELYALSQSLLTNQYSATSRMVSLNTWWRTAYTAAIVVTAVLTAGAAVMFVLSTVRKNKEVK